MLDKELMEKVLKKALEYGGDFAEIFFEDKRTNNIVAEGGVIEKVKSGFDMGVGIRVIYGEKVSYAFTDDLSPKELMEAARSAAAAAKGSGKDVIVIDLTRKSVPNLHPVKIEPTGYNKNAKVEIIMKADEAARVSDLIKQVTISFMDQFRKIMIANSEGLWVEDEQVFIRFTVSTVAQRGDLIQTGSVSKGKAMGIELFDLYDPEILARTAGEQAITMLNARPAPSGKMDVIINNGFGGVLFHEACGHGLEADAIVKGSSVFAGKVGQKVASSIVTAIDDPTIPNEWGSYNIDDEGTPAQRTVLIENGILREYMWDRVNAKKAGRLRSTGNGRRMSYRHLPIPRMTNTFIANGESKYEELFKNVQRGLFAKALGGGQVNTSTGDFVFAVREGYLIENGQITEPVRGATLVGNGPEVLHKIEMIADNLDFEPGMCGKQFQSVNAAVGQPTLLISDITVGGTERKGEK
ncbi:peptidase C69 [Anoxybacter fermentans]|uniref:Peptidase C69 n=1 Tax=Anoxybacter fermentans TaxID=1323375 RepID=A0A3S9SZK9_9FIRM|nr:TldD/PmbA family protein [Anoxybacter fermentans]AZR73731.1 peptidase C69 [Anoxybacter fermentans]